MEDKRFSLHIGRSKTLLAYLILLHSLLLITWLNLAVPISLNIAGVCLISISFVYYCHRFQWFTYAKAITRIERNKDERWVLFLADGKRFSRQTLQSSYVISHLLIMNFVGMKWWQRQNVVLCVDAVDRELFRQLRIFARNAKSYPQ